MWRKKKAQDEEETGNDTSPARLRELDRLVGTQIFSALPCVGSGRQLPLLSAAGRKLEKAPPKEIRLHLLP